MIIRVISRFAAFHLVWGGGRDHGVDVTTATDAAGSNRDGIERFVNVAISEVIQFRNEVCPAWVRFESEKVGPEVSGNLGFVLPQVLGGCSVLVPDVKFGGLRFGFSTDFNGRVVDYVVEGRPKAVDNIERYSGQFWRKWLSNLCLEDGRPQTEGRSR